MQGRREEEKHLMGPELLHLQIMNYTNPGAISHNEIMQLYKDYIDPEFTWENFTVEEQAKVRSPFPAC